MMRETIDLGTSQLMATFAETKTRITHLSSGAVYGTQPKDTASFSEEWSDNPSRVVPDSEYHQGKIRAEQRMNEEASDSQVVHARLFAFIAPYLPLDTHFAAGNFINAALRGEPLRVTGNPQTVRTYMYGIDLVLWLIRIALRGENKRAYNVGSDDPVTIGELASRIANQSKNRVDVEIVPQNTTSVEINRYIPNISRSRSELGLEIRIQLDEAIRRTLEWGYESV
jgi:dTDP-glucose 4,6-dehydratase